MTADENQGAENKRSFLGIWFDCCHTYGRLYKNKAGSYSIGKEKMTLATDDEIESLGAYGWWE